MSKINPTFDLLPYFSTELVFFYKSTSWIASVSFPSFYSFSIKLGTLSA